MFLSLWGGEGQSKWLKFQLKVKVGLELKCRYKELMTVGIPSVDRYLSSGIFIGAQLYS